MPEAAPIANYLKNLQCQLWAYQSHPRGGEPPHFKGVIRVYVNYFNTYSPEKISVDDVINYTDKFRRLYTEHVKD